MRSEATLSECGSYRYDLTRWWGAEGGRQAVWVMLNPSTADAALDDPTIRRCVGFSRGWGYDGLVVVNQFALRATDPRELNWATDPRGPENRTWMRRAIADPATGVVVAAWGAFRPGREWTDVRAMAEEAGVPLRCLGLTRGGAPRHPLYVRGDAQLVTM